MKKKYKVLCASLLAGMLCVNASAAYASEAQTEGSVTFLGEFSTEDINGESYTQEIFEDYDLTLVNVFATWCTPCVQEIPELEELHQAVAEKNVNVVGILLDGVDGAGKQDSQGIEKAKVLAEKTGATYPLLLPDSTFLNGRLLEVTAIPYTFFVDKNGNIVGNDYEGSRDFDSWKEIVETELANLEEPETVSTELESGETESEEAK